MYEPGRLCHLYVPFFVLLFMFSGCYARTWLDTLQYALRVLDIDTLPIPMLRQVSVSTP